MKVYKNGKLQTMTQEEEAFFGGQEPYAPPAPSLEETVEQQEQEIADLKAALNALLERRVV